MRLTIIDDEWGDFSSLSKNEQKLVQDFIHSLKPKIATLNELIRSYNEQTKSEEKNILLERIISEQRTIDAFYPDTTVSLCPEYIKKMHRTLVQEIQGERGLIFNPTTFTELLETIPPRKLDKMLRILLKTGFQQEHLSAVYDKDEAGREAFLAQVKAYDISCLGDGNSMIFEVTQKKSLKNKPKDKFILKTHLTHGLLRHK
jgi:hypothetical protein